MKENIFSVCIVCKKMNKIELNYYEQYTSGVLSNGLEIGKILDQHIQIQKLQNQELNKYSHESGKKKQDG